MSDLVGNSTTTAVVVRLDKTAPTLTSGRSAEPNTAGWYKDDVTISFPTCADNEGGSGLAGSCPTAVILGEGANQSVGKTVTDIAGNTSSPAGYSGINVDKTAPSLSGAPAAGPDGTNGWYTGDVTIRWTCADPVSNGAQSGIAGSGGSATCAALPDSRIQGEGRALADSASVQDKAGHQTTAPSGTIDIDRTDPSTEATPSAQPNGRGWYTSAVTLRLKGDDNLSGVGTTHYTVNGGGELTYAGEIAFDKSGVYTIAYWSVDQAGNAETARRITLRVDVDAPTIALKSRTPAANANSWNNTDVTVTWDCGDPLSGPTAATVSKTASTDGANQSATGICTDKAGNTNSATVNLINIDKVAPSIFDNGVTAGTPGSNGWYTSAVTNKFEATDTLSGVDPMQATISK